MDTFEAIEKRRAVKHYDPNHQLSQDEIDHLMQAALLSPTSFNIQNWRFVSVTDPAIRQEIREAAWGQAQVTEASLLLVICADLKAWAHNPHRYWHKAPQEVQNMLVPLITKFYDGNEQLQRDEAMRSGGIAAQTVMLAAKAMGYDSCPMIGFDEEAVARIINLPQDHVITMMVTIGKALKAAHPRGGPIPVEEAIIKDKF